MFNTQVFWLRILGLNPLKPFALPPGCAGERVGLRGQGERPRSWSHSGGPGEMVGLMQEDPQFCLWSATRSRRDRLESTRNEGLAQSRD